MAMYDVVVADARAPRDGRFIEKIGTYNPLTNPATIDLADERAFHWVMKGAQPTDTVKAMLSYRGIMFQKHLQIGVLKGALTQEAADKKLEEWKKAKEAQIQSKKDKLSDSKESKAKARKEAETKIKEARAEAIAKKNVVVEDAAEAPAEAEAATEEAAETTASAEATPAPEAAAEGDAPEATEEKA